MTFNEGSEWSVTINLIVITRCLIAVKPTGLEDPMPVPFIVSILALISRLIRSLRSRDRPSESVASTLEEDIEINVECCVYIYK